MSALSEKILKSRESQVVIGRHTFVVRRPTALEYEAKIRKGDAAQAILAFVVGWSGVVESDLFPGGDPHPAPFDAESCAEWLSDRPDLYSAVAQAVVDSFSAYVAKLDDAAKN